VLPIRGRRVRVAVVGCGDVAHRWYLPALASIADGVEVVAACDRDAGAAQRAAASVRSWSPDAVPFNDLDSMLVGAVPDAIYNLTPAPAHAESSLAALEAGIHVFSEKPLARSIASGDELIDAATSRGLLLLCAPASALTKRFRWLKQLVDGEVHGRLTLAVAHHADPGPASWREYTGDPTVFYQPGVGPLIDHGIYRLHELTYLMGPVVRVQAMGAIGSPTRVVRGGPLTGRTIEVTTPDHLLMNLEFADGRLGQLLASFGTPSTRAPWLELHFTRGTISFGPGTQYDANAPADLYVDEGGPDADEGWVGEAAPRPPADDGPLVARGAIHFIACLRGDEEPVLTAEHARHVLDVIEKVYMSVADGRSHATETTF
jgi:predicted dehydrogenase